MSANDQDLWGRLSPLFEEDDGGLYDVRLTGLTSSSGSRLAAHLQKRAVSLEGYAWDRVLNREVKVENLAEAALQVGAKRLQRLHVLLTGIQLNGIAIPDLGLYVWTDELTLDYRMGREWSASVLYAFFELLYELSLIEPNLKLDLGDTALPQWQREFCDAFAWYSQRRFNPEAG